MKLEPIESTKSGPKRNKKSSMGGINYSYLMKALAQREERMDDNSFYFKKY